MPLTALAEASPGVVSLKRLQARAATAPVTQELGAIQRLADAAGERAGADDRAHHDLAADRTVPVAQRLGAGAGMASPVLQRITIGATMRNYLNAHQTEFATLANNLQAQNPNITADTLKNAALDLSFTITDDPTLAFILVDDLANPINYSSCYPLAAAAFGILGRGERAGAGSADNFQSAHAFRGAVANLCTAITAAANNREEKIFRVEYAGHGFVLATRPDANDNMVVEHFESLAHSAALIESLPYSPYGVAETCTALRQMGHDREATREEGAAFFGWNHDAINLGPAATNDQGAFYRHRMKWWSRDLLNNWATRWQAQVRARYNQIKDVLHPATPAW